MKVTFLTAYFSPEITPVTHLFADLAADLARQGAEVTVVANTATRGLDEAARFAFRDRRDEWTDGVRILRVGAKGAEGRGLARRALHFLVNSCAIFFAARRLPADVYLINSMPPYLGFVGGLLAKRAPTVYILQDIFPDSVLAMGKLRAGGMLERAFRAMERTTYRRNTHFITISEDMRRTLLAKGVAAERLSVIPNWIDASHAAPVPRADNPVFDRFSLDRDAFTVCYAGTLGILQDIRTLLDAAAILKQEQPDIRFLLFGGGALTDETAARIAADALDNTRLLPLLPVHEAHLAYSAGDIAIVTLKKGVTGIAMPSKTWSALAAARPVVCTADAGSAWEQLLAASGAACIAEPEDARALADAILSLYRQRGSLAQMGEAGRAYVQAHLSRGAATRAYHAILQQVATEGDDHV